MNYKITQKQVNALAQVIYNARHENYSFAQIEGIIKMLNELPQVEETAKKADNAKTK